jgi:hypothetical protein
MSGGPARSFYEVLSVAQLAGPTIGSTTSTTSILPYQARFTLPAGFFDVVGKSIRIKALGQLSSTAAAPGTITWVVNFGTVASPIAVFTSQAVTMTTSAANLTYDLELNLTCRSVATTNATSATMVTAGRLLTAAASAGTVTLLPATSPTTGTGFDSTVTNTVDLQIAYSVAAAQNTTILQYFSLESLN